MISKQTIEELIAKGLTQYEIALRLHVSQTTIRYWLKKFNLKTNPKIKIDSTKGNCRFCKKLCEGRNSWKNHERICRQNIERKYENGMKGKTSWNKGLTKEVDVRVSINARNVSSAMQKKIKNGTYSKPRMGEKARRELSIKQSLRNTGGKCKWYEVNGIKVQGTWEREIAKKLTRLEIIWSKPTYFNGAWEYNLNDRIQRYTPDIYLSEYNLFLEIKGFWWRNDKEKMEAVIQQHKNKKLSIIENEEYNSLCACNSRQQFMEILNASLV